MKHGQVFTSEDIAAVQQGLSDDGYSNDYFNKLYGKKTNPHLGTDRDRKNKGNKIISTSSNKFIAGYNRIFK
jgi:hypothetical protein